MSEVWKVFIKILLVCLLAGNTTAEIRAPQPFHVFCESRAQTENLKHCLEEERTEFGANATSEELNHQPCFGSFDLEPFCGKTRWLVEDWGECLDKTKVTFDYDALEFLVDDVDFTFGVQQRKTTCILNHNKTMDFWVTHDLNCVRPESIPRTKLCVIPKPQDCVVSAPGPWSLCTSCHQPYRYRVKEILVPPLNGGKECPKLVETEDCVHQLPCQNHHGLLPQADFYLKIGEWGPCFSFNITDNKHSANGSSNLPRPRMPNFMPYFYKGNGRLIEEDIVKLFPYRPELGVQYREIACIKPNNDHTNPALCRGFKQIKVKTPLVRMCVLNEDCESESDGWKMTDIGCIGLDGKLWPNVYKRLNSVMKPPMGDGKFCEPSIEITNEYENLKDCGKLFSFVVSPWSACSFFINDRLQPVECGGGIRSRTISCLSVADDEPVDISYCSRFVKIGYNTVEPCEVPCPVDCVVSNWSPWSECFSNGCFYFNMNDVSRTRERTVVVQPLSGGKECPHLEESGYCSENKCDDSQVSGLDPCIFGNRTCKHSCASQFVNVKSKHCENVEIQQTKCSFACQDCISKDERAICTFPCEKSVNFSSNSRFIIRSSNESISCLPAKKQVDYCYDNCRTYHWKVSPWTLCRGKRVIRHEKRKLMRLIDPNQKFRNFQGIERESYKYGIATRLVFCVNEGDVNVLQDMCVSLNKPEEVKACVIEEEEEEEERKCITTEWSSMKPCEVDCDPGQDLTSPTIFSPITWRTRVVLSQSINSDCGPLIQLSPCSFNYVRCQHYMWIVGEWSECRSTSKSIKCAPGYQIRSFWCALTSSDTIVTFNHCFDAYKFYPQSVKKCQSNCGFGRNLSLCECKVGVPFQKIDVTDLRTSGNSANAWDTQEDSECECEIYSGKVDTKWSKCIITNSSIQWSNGELDLGLCGSGTRYKRHVCLDSKNRLADPNFCYMYNTSILLEDCEIPCPMDCIVTDWSEWTPCSKDCDIGHQKRSRRIVRDYSNNGRPCPPLNEVRFCRNDCSIHKWKAMNWNKCELYEETESNCGAGIQRRQTWCFEINKNSWIIVPDKWCHGLERPELTRNCTVFCSGDCVYGNWQDWGSCCKNCTGARVRTRQHHCSPSNQICNETTEAEKCELNKNCFTYAWTHTQFGPCIPHEKGEQDCGQGFATRIAICEKSDGIIVDDSYCVGQPVTFETELFCKISCPIDCFLSQWSKWDKSHCLIGNANGEQYRFRKILVKPNKHGRPCHHVEETMPCPVSAKYDWRVSAWSSCQVEKDFTCGYGIKTREVVCTMYSKIVEPKYCMGTYKVIKKGESLDLIDNDMNEIDRRLQNMETEVDCYLPCPREIDCKITDWSQWSSCYLETPFHKNASVNNFQLQGVQSRSKGVVRQPRRNGELCPKNLLETRPCLITQRIYSVWGYDESGQPICLRSDGRIILDGCDETEKICSKFCSEYGVWTCLPGPCTCRPDLSPPSHLCRSLISSTTELTTTLKTIPEYRPGISISLKVSNNWLFTTVTVLLSLYVA